MHLYKRILFVTAALVAGGLTAHAAVASPTRSPSLSQPAPDTVVTPEGTEIVFTGTTVTLLRPEGVEQMVWGDPHFHSWHSDLGPILLPPEDDDDDDECGGGGDCDPDDGEESQAPPPGYNFDFRSASLTAVLDDGTQVIFDAFDERGRPSAAGCVGRVTVSVGGQVVALTNGLAETGVVGPVATTGVRAVAAPPAPRGEVVVSYDFGRVMAFEGRVILHEEALEVLRTAPWRLGDRVR